MMDQRTTSVRSDTGLWVHPTRRTRPERPWLSVMGLAVFVGAVAISSTAAAQTSPLGGSRVTLQPGSNVNTLQLVSKDPLGRPCADLEGASRAHVTNPNIYDHVVSVLNRCVKPLKLKVCYFGSDRCVDVDLPGGKRKDVVIGVQPAMKTFRYSYKEVR